MAHRTIINRRQMHYLIDGTGAFHFLKPNNLCRRWRESFMIRYDTTLARHGYTRETATVSQKERKRTRPTGWPTTDTPSGGCHKSWCRSCTTGQEREVSYTDAVLPFASVIDRVCENSVSRISNPIVRRVNLTCAQTWPRRRAENSQESSVDSAHVLSSDCFFCHVTTGG